MSLIAYLVDKIINGLKIEILHPIPTHSLDRIKYINANSAHTKNVMQVFLNYLIKYIQAA